MRPDPRKAALLARMPRAFRPRLTAEQVRTIGLVHITNLEAIAHGQADVSVLRDWVSDIFTWSRVAELMGTGEPEMVAQLELAGRVIDRFKRTGRVGFDGPDYQLAKTGTVVMDLLAEQVDKPTAEQAAHWSETQLNKMNFPIEKAVTP